MEDNNKIEKFYDVNLYYKLAERKSFTFKCLIVILRSCLD